MKYGYARVSKEKQSEASQVGAFNQHGCDEIIIDKGSSRDTDPFKRPLLKTILDDIGEGDVLIVWKLDRLASSVVSLVKVLDHLKERKADLITLTEGFDTSTRMGKAFAQIAMIFAEMELEGIRERTKAGLAIAKKNGKRLGRPPRLSPEQVALAKSEIAAKRQTISSMAQVLGCDRNTLSKAIRA